MANKVKIRNINPVGRVDVPILRRQGKPLGEKGKGCLEPGEVIEVDAEIAGVAPHWRPATPADADAIARRQVQSRSSGEGEDAVVEVYDLGSGLLAQVSNYEVATPPKKKG